MCEYGDRMACVCVNMLMGWHVSVCEYVGGMASLCVNRLMA